MSKKYYTLLSREGAQRWRIEFGDYSRNVVTQEMRDMKDSSDFVKGTKFKIITTGDKQVDIDAAVAALNGDVK